jgi:uncharacterized protein (DUF1501 family)
MSITRRRFLSRGAAATLLAGEARAESRAPSVAGETLVFVVLRGGADALSLLVPLGDADYHRARPTLALKPPGSGPNAALALTPEFGLHPRLAVFKRWFDEGELGVIAGAGLGAGPCGHRSAERALEQAVHAALGGRAAERVSGALEPALLALAERIRRGSQAPRAAWIEQANWDTHVGQGSPENGRLSFLCAELARALAAFRAASGSGFGRTRLIVVSEFGRALGETRLGGSDDGNATALWVLDGRRKLGRVVGDYGSLAPSSLGRGGAIVPTRELTPLLSTLARGEFP